MSESRRRFRYSVVIVADSQEQADLTMEMRLGPREARTADSCMWRPETEFRAGAGTEEVRPRPSTRSGHPTREASRQPQLPVESAAVPGPVEEPLRQRLVRFLSEQYPHAPVNDHQFGADGLLAIVGERDARVRAEERQRTLLEAADALYSDDGPGNLLSTATWLRERAVLAAGSAVPVATPERECPECRSVTVWAGKDGADSEWVPCERHQAEAIQRRAALPEPSDETHCHRCGGKNCVWFAPSPLWNEVMRGGDINGPWQWNEIICPPCFAELAEAAGVVTPGWRFTADNVLVPLTTVTPSGRVWDEASQLWIGPVATLTESAEDFETRVEYGHQTIDVGWVPEHRGIKYASHQREVQFRLGEPVLLDHWSDPDGRRLPVTETALPAEQDSRSCDGGDSCPFTCGDRLPPSLDRRSPHRVPEQQDGQR